MKATEILMGEHRVIERVLSAVERAAPSASPGFFLRAAEFIRGFADGCHHRKEEGVLFEAMVAHGLPRDTGPVAVMLAEHEQGRAFTRALSASAERWQAGELEARAEVLENAAGYVTLLHQHIAKEDTILFPMADQVIPAAEHDRVEADLERIEHDETGEGLHERFEALAARLEQEAEALDRGSPHPAGIEGGA